MKYPKEIEQLIHNLVRSKGNIPAMVSFKKGLQDKYMTIVGLNQIGAIEIDPTNGAIPLVAGMFAKYKNHTDKLASIGAVLRRMYNTKDSQSAGERRLLKILKNDYFGIRDDIPHVLSLLKNYQINYIQLHEDLKYWGDSVQLRWARDFYKGGSNKCK